MPKTSKLSVQPSLITEGAGIVATSPPHPLHPERDGGGGVARVGDQARTQPIYTKTYLHVADAS